MVYDRNSNRRCCFVIVRMPGMPGTPGALRVVVLVVLLVFAGALLLTGSDLAGAVAAVGALGLTAAEVGRRLSGSEAVPA